MWLQDIQQGRGGWTDTSQEQATIAEGGATGSPHDGTQGGEVTVYSSTEVGSTGSVVLSQDRGPEAVGDKMSRHH